MTVFKMPKKPHINTITTKSGTTSFLTMGEGDGPPLVCLHGFAGDKLTWQFFLQPLSKLGRLYAFDLPGHGTTDCPDIRDVGSFAVWLSEVLDALELDQPHILAHSMGGRVALDYAEKHQVSSLHLLSCAGLSPTFNSAILHALSEAKDIETLTQLVRQMVGNNERLVFATAKALIGKLNQDDHSKALSQIIQSSKQRSDPARFQRPDLNAIKAPLHFYWGTEDQIVPQPSDLPETADCLMIEGAGHMLPLEASRVIVQKIKDALDTQPHAG